MWPTTDKQQVKNFIENQRGSLKEEDNPNQKMKSIKTNCTSTSKREKTKKMKMILYSVREITF